MESVMADILEKNDYVRARVPHELKSQAENILAQVGLSTSEAIRLLLTQVVNRGQFPLELQMPNQTTIDAMNADVEPQKYHSAKELFADLDDDTDD